MRVKIPDRMKALSLINSAKKDIGYTLSLKISEDSANTIVRNVYECFRMLGEALLIAKGIENFDHIASIDELVKLNVKTDRPLNVLQNLRKLRHNINYYGYAASIKEAGNIISITESCFGPLFDEVMRIVRKKEIN